MFVKMLVSSKMRVALSEKIADSQVLFTAPSLFLFAYSWVLGQRNSKQKYFRLEEPLSSMFIQFRPIGRKHFVKALIPEYLSGKHNFSQKIAFFIFSAFPLHFPKNGSSSGKHANKVDKQVILQKLLHFFLKFNFCKLNLIL